jgi:hypothetical protein
VLAEHLTLFQGLAIAMVMAASMGTAWSAGRPSADLREQGLAPTGMEGLLGLGLFCLGFRLGFRLAL